MVGVLRFELKASASRTQRATNCAIPRKKTAADAAVWLRKKDSNPHNASQSRRCYHYTIPHCIHGVSPKCFIIIRRNSPDLNTFFQENPHEIKSPCARFAVYPALGAWYNNLKPAACAAARSSCADALSRTGLRTLNHAKPQQVRFCWGRFAASWYNRVANYQRKGDVRCLPLSHLITN